MPRVNILNILLSNHQTKLFIHLASQSIDPIHPSIHFSMYLIHLSQKIELLQGSDGLLVKVLG